MCRVLSQDLRGMNGLGDLATVLGVTGDDEAAKLISSASLSQMVRVSPDDEELLYTIPVSYYYSKV